MWTLVLIMATISILIGAIVGGVLIYAIAKELHAGSAKPNPTATRRRALPEQRSSSPATNRSMASPSRSSPPKRSTHRSAATAPRTYRSPGPSSPPTQPYSVPHELLDSGYSREDYYAMGFSDDEIEGFGLDQPGAPPPEIAPFAIDDLMRRDDPWDDDFWGGEDIDPFDNPDRGMFDFGPSDGPDSDPFDPFDGPDEDPFDLDPW